MKDKVEENEYSKDEEKISLKDTWYDKREKEYTAGGEKGYHWRI